MTNARADGTGSGGTQTAAFLAGGLADTSPEILKIKHEDL